MWGGTYMFRLDAYFPCASSTLPRSGKEIRKHASMPQAAGCNDGWLSAGEHVEVDRVISLRGT